jgi:hypothetical protein
MDILSTEATAFMRAAEVVGLELPATIKEATAALVSLDEQIGKLPAPEKVPSPASLVADGTPLDKVGKEHERRVAKERQKAELRKTAQEARSLARRTVSIRVAQEREGLIRALNPIVVALIEEARPLAELLAPFAPKYEAGTIVRKASMEQVEAWRASEELERKFGVCMAAWRAGFGATTRLGGHKSPAHMPGFDVRNVNQAHYYWEWPERVLNPRLNGTYYAAHRGAPSTIQPTVLSVACERPECGFRLATVREMADLYPRLMPAKNGLGRRERRSGEQPIPRRRHGMRAI